MPNQGFYMPQTKNAKKKKRNGARNDVPRHGNQGKHEGGERKAGGGRRRAAAARRRRRHGGGGGGRREKGEGNEETGAAAPFLHRQTHQRRGARGRHARENPRERRGAGNRTPRRSAPGRANQRKKTGKKREKAGENKWVAWEAPKAHLGLRGTPENACDTTLTATTKTRPNKPNHTEQPHRTTTTSLAIGADGNNSTADTPNAQAHTAHRTDLAPDRSNRTDCRLPGPNQPQTENKPGYKTPNRRVGFYTPSSLLSLASLASRVELRRFSPRFFSFLCIFRLWHVEPLIRHVDS